MHRTCIDHLPRNSASLIGFFEGCYFVLLPSEFFRYFYLGRKPLNSAKNLIRPNFRDFTAAFLVEEPVGDALLCRTLVLELKSLETQFL